MIKNYNRYHIGPTYEGTVADGIDFKKAGYPPFIDLVYGVSGPEPWGRWTDANESRKDSVASFIFNKSLPDSFILELQATAFGPNHNTPIAIRVGNTTKKFTVTEPSFQTFYIDFDNVGDQNIIDIIPPHPTTPNSTNSQSADFRRLGIGMVYLKIKAKE